VTPRNGQGSTRRSLLSPSRARIRSTLATIVDKPDDLRELRIVHKALADINRLRIVRRLAGSDASVTDLIEEIGMSQPLVSWHVGRLRVAGLVATRRNGRETVCSLRADAFEAFVARERVILGLAGDGETTTDPTPAASISSTAARRVAAS
jgi:ArsR family transcriptional regulator, arsenate/arsenite/antimonite-responsive transcriptional repressor